MYSLSRYAPSVKALLVSALALGCAGTKNLDAAFSKRWHHEEGREGLEILSRLDARGPRVQAPAVVGLSGRELVGLNLEHGEIWKYAAEPNVLPSISGGTVAFTSGPKVIVLDLKTGQPRFELPSANRRLEAYASDEAHAIFLLVDEHDARPDLVLVTDRSGRIKSETTTLERVGTPWVGGGIGLIPWANQYISAIDLDTGVYVGRFLARSAPNRVLENSSGLFLSGGGGLVPLGPELARNPDLPGANFSVRGFPGEPEWPVDGSKPRIARATPIAVVAEPTSDGGTAKFQHHRFIATYFQLVAAFSTDPDGKPLWANSFPRAISGIDTSATGALVCLEDGTLHTLDWLSGTKEQVGTLDTRLSACVVEAGDLSIDSHEPEPVETRIVKAIRSTGPSMATFQQFLIEKLTTLESDAATSALINITLDPLSSSTLVAAARRGLKTRTVGYDVMIRALQAGVSAELSAEAQRPTPFASLAEALARAEQRQAAAPLAQALVVANLSGPDALSVMNAVLALGGSAEAKHVREFFVRNKNVATDDDMRNALVGAARFLWRQGGSVRTDVKELAAEKMTHSELARVLEIAFVEEENGPAPKSSP